MSNAISTGSHPLSGGGSVSDSGVVNLPDGETLDVTTAEGMAAAEEVLDPAMLEELKGIMEALGYKLDGGAYDKIESKRDDKNIKGPGDSSAGRTEADEQLAAALEELGYTDPYNAATTEKLYNQIKDDPRFQAAAAALEKCMSGNIDPAAMSEQIKKIAISVNELAKGGMNAMEMLYLVFRESVKDNNEDKKYFLKKLQDFNTISQKLNEYLKDLNEVAQKTDKSGEDNASKVSLPSPVKKQQIDLNAVGPDGKAVSVPSTEPDLQHLDDLQSELKNVEADQETVKNNRQQAQTSFQNFDQKGTQLMNLLSQVVKTMNEMRSIGPASRSGM